MRAWSRFWVVLDPKYRKLFVLKAFDRVVVEIHVRHLKVGRARNPAFVASDREAVVLRRYKYPSRIDFLDGMITATMSVRHLDRIRAVRQTKDLVAEADAENWHAFVRDFPNRFGRVVHRG